MPDAFRKVGSMSHRNSANATSPKSQLALVSGLADVIKRDARQIAILVLVLVLLITNGGAG